MAALEAILLGMIQGILEFLPVSSLGHLTILERMMGFPATSDVLFEAFLHMGTLVAVLLVFWRDVQTLPGEFFSVFLTGMGNLRIYLSNRRRNDPLPYQKTVTGLSEKLTVMLLLTTIPTFLIGFTAKNLVSLSRTTEYIAPIGILMTGIVLLVTDLGAPVRGKKGLADAEFDQAVWLGVCQGISVFPGISRLGLALSLSQLFGYKVKFALRYAYLMSVPAVIGAFCAELPHITEMSREQILSCVLGMIAAGITGYFTIRLLLRLLSHVRLRVFAFYCFAMGIGILVSEYLL